MLAVGVGAIAFAAAVWLLWRAGNTGDPTVATDAGLVATSDAALPAPAAPPEEAPKQTIASEGALLAAGWSGMNATPPEAADPAKALSAAEPTDIAKPAELTKAAATAEAAGAPDVTHVAEPVEAQERVKASAMAEAAETDANEAGMAQLPVVANRPVIFPDLKLQGVYYRLVKPSAMINNRTLYVGDRIEGVRLVEIKRHSVQLELGGEIKELSLR